MLNTGDVGSFWASLKGPEKDSFFVLPRNLAMSQKRVPKKPYW